MDVDKAGGRPEDKIMLVPDNSVKVVVDRWLPFKVTAFEIAQMYILRQRLMASILFKVKHPNKNLPPHLCASMYAIASILSYDGVTQPSVKTIAVKPVASVGNMEEDTPSDLANGNVQAEANSASNLSIGNTKDNLPSYRVNGNEQTEPKSVINLDLGNVEEKMPSDLANGNEKTEPKSTNKLDYGNMEESLPSNLASGDEQPDPNTAPMEAVSAANQLEKKRSRSKKRKSANNLDLGNIEEKKPSDLANGNEQPDPNIAPEEAALAPKQPKKKHLKSKRRKLADNLESGNNMEENMPSTNEIEQPNLINALAEVASMAEQQKDEVQTESKSGNKSDLIEEKVSIPPDHVKGNEQSDPNTGSTEAA